MVDEKRTIEKVFTCECKHAGTKVTVSTVLVYPADHIPDTPPHILNRDCSHITECNLHDKCACPFAVGQLSNIHTPK